ncbi:hypothetical protein PHACT_08935 [Pseudohongiella acticola]|uniref:Uncharacterized protein n=1 Tax=Pseudohongiella acticola TaxID=1524254 RepID=A0A1E8CLG3_9GAMM|nr:hypothetical protein PHACT_08935 [Pseudohongiella acticola]
MPEPVKDHADKSIKEHLSISVSLVVFWLVVWSGQLPDFLQAAAGLAAVVGIIYNHLLCRRLSASAINQSRH